MGDEEALEYVLEDSELYKTAEQMITQLKNMRPEALREMFVEMGRKTGLDEKSAQEFGKIGDAMEVVFAGNKVEVQNVNIDGEALIQEAAQKAMLEEYTEEELREVIQGMNTEELEKFEKELIVELLPEITSNFKNAITDAVKNANMLEKPALTKLEKIDGKWYIVE